jgi:hypothetical protein
LLTQLKSLLTFPSVQIFGSGGGIKAWLLQTMIGEPWCILFALVYLQYYSELLLLVWSSLHKIILSASSFLSVLMSQRQGRVYTTRKYSEKENNGDGFQVNWVAWGSLLPVLLFQSFPSSTKVTNQRWIVTYPSAPI